MPHSTDEGTGFTLRKASYADAGAMHRVEMASVQAGWVGFYSQEQIHAWCRHLDPEFRGQAMSARDLLVVEADGDVIAFGQFDREKHNVDALYVSPGQFQHGHGARLLQAFERMARHARLPALTLSASLNAVGFYHRCGYGAVAERLIRLRGGACFRCVRMKKTIPEP